MRHLLLGILCAATGVHAWGVLGHQTVAALAEDMLTPKAKAEVSALLGPAGAGGSLPRIATWADDIRILRPETRPWHYVDIQLDAPKYDPAKTDTPNVATALKQALATLRRAPGSPAASGTAGPTADADRYAREEALKWVVHLVGDLHQPLHVGEDHDKGGNLVKVKLGRRTYNLHEVWDYVLLERLQLPLDSLHALLAAQLAADPGYVSRNAGGTVEDWVNETHAKSAACYLVRGKAGREAGEPMRKGIKASLERDYVRPNTLVVVDQLKRAAVRLAQALNQALDPAAPKTPMAPRPPPGAPQGGPGRTSADPSAVFAHSEELPEAPKTPAFFWSARSRIYHVAGCADIAKIKRKNLRSGDAPPPLLELHKGCPAR